MWLFRRCDSPTKVSFAAEKPPALTDPKTGPLQPRGVSAGPFAKRGRESIGRTPTPLNRPIHPLFRRWFSFWFFAVMADPLEHATGIEKREMLAELAGNDVRPEFWLWHPSRALWPVDLESAFLSIAPFRFYSKILFFTLFPYIGQKLIFL
jgi:hypothetical protein